VRAEIRAILRRHDLHLKKRLGQHFLASAAILDRIVARAELSPRDAVLEVGAGLGTLTRRLAEQAGCVVAVEVDETLIPALREATAPYPHVRIVRADVLRLDLPSLFPAGFVRKVVSNLPYRIASTLIVRLLEEVGGLERLVLTVQREVAERLVAAPGTKDYGLLTLLVRYRAHAEVAERIPPTAFLPPPRVESAVVVLRPHAPPEVADEALLFRLVRAAFAQRRKQLRNALKPLGLPSGVLAAAACKAGVDLAQRGEALPLEAFLALTNALAEHRLDSRARSGNRGPAGH
jgi:16S rRNA (adenine1518-N6/adenine1519-N6)-dimethyltransferase